MANNNTTSQTSSGYRIGIDVGGTFTDLALYDTETDRVWLIDCGDLQFARASRDLANFQPFMKSWIATEEAHRRFIEAYLSHSPPSRREELQRERAFFEAFLILSRLRKDVCRSEGEAPEWPEGSKKDLMRRHLLSLAGVKD